MFKAILNQLLLLLAHEPTPLPHFGFEMKQNGSDRYLNMPIIGYLAKAGSTGCTSANRGAWLVRGNMVGILIIGSYIYHLDVIAIANVK